MDTKELVELKKDAEIKIANILKELIYKSGARRFSVDAEIYETFLGDQKFDVDIKLTY